MEGQDLERRHLDEETRHVQLVEPVGRRVEAEYKTREKIEDVSPGAPKL